jgi:hypothetical protein
MIPYRPLFLVPTGLLALVLLAAGCGDSTAERPSPTPTPLERQATPPPAPRQTAAPTQQSPSASAERVPSTSPDSAAAQLRQKKVPMPRLYPSDAPVYPGTEPTQVIETPNGRITVMFGTDDPADEVMAFMTDFLPDAGWEVGAVQELPTGQVVQGTKGDRRISLLISRVDEGRESAITMIAISVDS